MALDLNVDVGSVFTGIGSLAKDLREAITGDISAEKKAEITLKAQALEGEIEKARLSVMVAEASSQDKWTSRARPSFMYVIYIMILASIPMGFVYAYNPVLSANIITGFGTWLKAIPSDLYTLFGAGYLGYTGMRTYEKVKK
jgi:hypothetical protein